MTTASRFDRFLRNITLTKDEREAALSRAHNVARKLHDHYYPFSVYTGATKRLIGSHGKKTRVRPVRDVDMAFHLPKSAFDRFDSYSGNGQSALLQEIRRILNERYPNTKIKGDGPVVLASFTSGHTVEVLPAYRGPSGPYRIPVTKDGGRWEVSDYDAEFTRLDESDKATNGQTRRLIKMMKVWQGNCNVPIKSLCLELRAENFLDSWSYRGNSSTYDDWMVRDFLEELIARANYYCEIPGITERCYYGDAWLSRAKTAYSNALKACEYEAGNDESMASFMWTRIFGDQYDD